MLTDKAPRSDPSGEISQSQAALLMGVDRTTIRAWTKAGMPYEAPTERGKEGRYRLGVCMLWSSYQGLREKLPDVELSPLEALAVTRLMFDVGSTNNRRAVCEFREFFPGMVATYFSRTDIDQAMGLAIGYARVLVGGST